jgi:hypothetical protein
VADIDQIILLHTESLRLRARDRGAAG